MRKNLELTLIIVILFILDNSIMPLISIGGYYPSLLLIFLCSYSIINGSFEGVVIGAIAGLLQDLYFSNIFGINAFSNMLVGLIGGYIGRNLFKERILIPSISIFAMSFIKGILVICFLFIFGKNLNFYNIIFSSFYNMIFALIIYHRVYKFANKDYMKKDWNF